MLAPLIPTLRTFGWSVHDGATTPFPPPICERYAWVPAELRGFLEGMLDAENPSKTAWFITPHSVAHDTDFPWNAWELMAIDAAATDGEWVDQIRTFWNNHFPFLLSVRDGYAYFAVRNEPGFPVVYGREPQFELPDVVAASFVLWSELLVAVLTGTQTCFEIENALEIHA